MKDSKDKEYRISNLKDMMDTVKDNENDPDYENIEEDSELIEYLNEDTDDYYEELEIDDEYIYHPGDDDSDSVNLEENPIDEDYLIQTPKPEDGEDTPKDDADELEDELTGEISENFDNVVNAKVRGRPVLAIVSSILGVILLIISAYIFQSRSDRIIDNVVAGETNFMFVIFFIAGLFLLVYGIYRLFNIKNPFENITNSIDSIDDNKKETTKPDKEEPSPKVIPKSNIPLDKEAYKIGEFAVEDLKPTPKKPTSKKDKKETSSKDSESTQDIPPAKEKTYKNEELSEEEIEDMEYEKAKLESESIDDIFAEAEDIEDIPIISVDSKEEEKDE